MELTIKIPDQVWNEDPSYKRYFEGVQKMVDRMAMSHYKYGPVRDNAVLCEVEEVMSGEKRVAMYKETGNTENVLDAANFFLIEWMYPKHPKAYFKSQSSASSPGLEYKL